MLCVRELGYAKVTTPNKSDVNIAQARNAAVINRQSPAFMSNADLELLPGETRRILYRALEAEKSFHSST